MRQWLTPADGILLTFTIVAIGALYAALWTPIQAGLEVEIWRAGEQFERLTLADNRDFEVLGILGSTQIEIRQGQARIVASPCHNKSCIQSGWQRHAGEIAACLPNQVSLRIVGADPRFDAINF